MQITPFPELDLLHQIKKTLKTHFPDLVHETQKIHFTDLVHETQKTHFADLVHEIWKIILLT